MEDIGYNRYAKLFLLIFMVVASVIYFRYIYSYHGVQLRDIYIYDDDEIHVDFDNKADSRYIGIGFSVETLSVSQIMEYLKWKNQRACEVTKTKISF